MAHRARLPHALLCIAALALTTHSVFGSILLTGDTAAAAGETFSFAVTAHAQGTEDAFYVGARSVGAQDFALARVRGGQVQFGAMAPEVATVNYEQEQANPLFNKGIAFLDVLSQIQGMGPVDRLAVVTTDPAQAASVYVAERFSDGGTASVLSVDAVKDAAGLTTSGIVALTATKSGQAGVFVAVKPNAGGTFGDAGSGIALLNFAQLKVEEDGKEVSRLIFEQLPAQLGSDQIRSAVFDKSAAFLKITNNLAAMTNVVDMHWDASLRRLFVVIQGTAGAGATDGLRAVAVGQIVEVEKVTKLVFVPIAPDAVFAAGAGNEVVGGRGAGAQVSWHKVRTLRSSTGLDYLIGVGANGAPSATTRMVFALPLVNTMDGDGRITDIATHGTLAKVDATPQALFSNNDPSVFRRRVITTPAKAKADIYTTASPQAMVGGGALAAGDIVDIVVARDTVFAMVGEPADGTQKPGVFYSQALFDEEGKIIRWTPWRRAGGTAIKMFGMGFSTVTGDITFMTGDDATMVRTVKRTQWSLGDVNGLQPFGGLLMHEFQKDNAGVQGFFDFQESTPGLTDMSVFVATGFKKVLLVESGRRVAGAFTPNGGDFILDKQTFTNGTITPAANAKVLSITGGVLDNLGAIVSAEIGVSGTQGYLFVGGVGGLGVLANNDGTGWNAAAGLMPNFVGLPSGMNFKKIGDYSFVRALIADGDFLYVLTDTRMDRITMSTSNFATGDLDVATVATLILPAVEPNGTLLDFVVSDKFALLSTTNGLYRIGNNKNIATVVDQEDAAWTFVPVNEGTGSVTQLLALSTTGRAQDVARNGGGNIYALNAYAGRSRGQVNRFVVADISASAITNTTVQPLPDILVEGIPSYFKNFGGFANQFATDGAINLYTRGRNLTRAPFVKSIQSVMPISDVQLPLDLASASNLVRVAHSFASGSWVIIGDVARFNE